MTVFLDVRPEIGLKRAKVKTRFEKAGVAFQSKVRLGFLKAIREDRKRWIVIRAGKKTPDQIVTEIILGMKAILKTRFPSHKGQR